MKTTQECWQALIDGETLADSIASVSLNKNGMLLYENGRPALVAFQKPEDWEIYTPPKWYDNIPEHGVLCWVWDCDTEDKRIACVDQYIEDSVYEFRISKGDDLYKYATPLTKQEIQTLLDNAPEDKE